MSAAYFARERAVACDDKGDTETAATLRSLADEIERLTACLARLVSVCRKIRDEHSRCMQELVEDDAWTFSLTAGVLVELHDAIAQAERRAKDGR